MYSMASHDVSAMEPHCKSQTDLKRFVKLGVTIIATTDSVYYHVLYSTLRDKSSLNQTVSETAFNFPKFLILSLRANITAIPAKLKHNQSSDPTRTNAVRYHYDAWALYLWYAGLIFQHHHHVFSMMVLSFRRTS